MIKGRFKYGEHIFKGWIEGKRVIEDKGLYYDSYQLSELEILSPVEPGKIICVGLNYRDHAEELGMQIPAEPILFLKPPSSVIAHKADIIYPAMSHQVDYEAELAVVIGKRCKHVSAELSNDVITGYTCFNDVTARDLQRIDGQWTRAKSFDTFAPIGPFIVSDIDPAARSIKCRVNGRIRQNSNTRNMIFGIPHLIEFISNIMTLEAGDVIATGTPPGVGPMLPGDEVEVYIEGVGILQNRLIKEQA